jgi:hypothetical protein
LDKLIGSNVDRLEYTDGPVVSSTMLRRNRILRSIETDLDSRLRERANKPTFGCTWITAGDSTRTTKGPKAEWIPGRGWRIRGRGHSPEDV